MEELRRDYGRQRAAGNASVIGDANHDGNTNNDRIPAARRNSFVGPDYTTTDIGIGRTIFRHNKVKLDFTAEY